MSQHIDAHVLQRGAQGHRLVPPEQRLLDAQRLTAMVMVEEGRGAAEGMRVCVTKRRRPKTKRFIAWRCTYAKVFRGQRM